MAARSDGNNYQILIDGRWDLEDLFKMPRAYEQIYFALHSLKNDDPDYMERIERAFNSMPWQGGYSAVNFYNNLKYIVSKKDRPQIRGIQYGSPGWIDLMQIAVPTAISIAVIVRSVCSSLNTANTTYTNIHKGMSERKLLRIATESAEIDFVVKYQKFINKSKLDMAEILHIDNVSYLDYITKKELKTLKILLSIFRRVKLLCDFQIRGKLHL